jgi:hypothetical protein
MCSIENNCGHHFEPLLFIIILSWTKILVANGWWWGVFSIMFLPCFKCSSLHQKLRNMNMNYSSSMVFLKGGGNLFFLNPTHLPKIRWETRETIFFLDGLELLTSQTLWCRKFPWQKQRKWLNMCSVFDRYTLEIMTTTLFIPAQHSNGTQ